MRAGARTFAWPVLVTLSTLTYQLLLTRTFSVTMYYHLHSSQFRDEFGWRSVAVVVFFSVRGFVSERVSAISQSVRSRLP